MTAGWFGFFVGLLIGGAAAMLFAGACLTEVKRAHEAERWDRIQALIQQRTESP